MPQNTKLRIWQWSVMLLMLCNVGLIATIWLRPHLPGRHDDSARNFIISNLKFSPEQIKAYDSLIKDHRSAMNRLHREGMDYRAALFAGLAANAATDRAADSLCQVIANNQKEIEIVTYRHFQSVRNLCTDDQKKEFDKIIGQVMKMMNGPGHGGPPPPRHDDNNGPPPDPNGPPGGQGPPPPPDGEGAER